MLDDDVPLRAIRSNRLCPQLSRESASAGCFIVMFEAEQREIRLGVVGGIPIEMVYVMPARVTDAAAEIR